MTLVLRRHLPQHGEPQAQGLPAKGPAWLIPPTQHRDERVTFDDGTLSVPHYESGRLATYFRSTTLDAHHPGLLPVPSRLATAAAHLALGETREGLAIADLCVTGRGSLAQLGPADRIDWAAVRARADTAPLLPGLVAQRFLRKDPPLPLPEPHHLGAVVDRARDVHTYLQTPGDQRSPLRARLGWIAVSGEDDLPWRPVNVDVTCHPQHEVTVRVWGLDVRLRYVLAGELTATSKNVLLLHGHSSRLEEVEDLITALQKRGYTVLAFDLPGNGYSTQPVNGHVLFAERPVRNVSLPYAREAQSLENHSSLYVLRFFQACVSAFVGGVFARAGLAPRIDLLAGGSLGGNLALLFAERTPRGDSKRHPWVDPGLGWLGKIASWSPACLWDQPAIAHGVPHQRSQEIESPDRRRDHINRWMNVDHIGPIAIRQAEQWYRRGYGGKAKAIADSWLYRHEVYSPLFRQWHWLVAHEQVKLSHQHPVLDAKGQATAHRHYELTGGDLLLMAGDGDNFSNTRIFERVMELGPRMPANGFAMLWSDTGHSIHNERPNELAFVLDAFVGGSL